MRRDSPPEGPEHPADPVAARPPAGDGALRPALDAASVGILYTDRDCRITFLNAAGARMLGLSPDDTVGKPVGDVTPSTAEAFEQIIRTGEPQSGVKIAIATGTVIADRSPVLDGGGRVVGVVSVFKEISRYEQTAKELEAYKQLARQLEAICHYSYDGLYVTNGEADAIFYNKAFLRVSGLADADVEGKNTRELLRRGTISQSVSLQVIAKRRRVTIEQQFNNGRTAIVTGNPVFDEEGKVVYVVSNVRDITELNELRAEIKETRSLANRYREELKKASLEGVDRSAVVFRSAAMETCVGLALRVSDVASPVLLTGESGVGKGMLARLVHNLGARKAGPFIHVNCGAIPATLIEAELFGYERGAFTGASDEGKPGYFELADGGTLFLDEVGDMPPPVQVALLKVLEEHEVRRVGGTRARKLDVRIVAATNRDLREAIRARTFREDLYFRLNVFPIHVPPLRERPEDIPPLVERIVGELNARYGKVKRVRPETLDLLTRYPFPGNVRDLQNVAERAFILADGKWLEPEHLPPEIQRHGSVPASRAPAAGGKRPTLAAMLERLEKEILERSLAECGSTHQMAKQLGVSQPTIVRKLQKLGIPAAPPRRRD